MTGVTPEPEAGPYKVVELASVTDREIESALNRWTADGYRIESVHFVCPPGSRRPSMAFLLFTRAAGPVGE